MEGGAVWGIPMPPEACDLLSSVRNKKKIGTRRLVFLVTVGQGLSTG